MSAKEPFAMVPESLIGELTGNELKVFSFLDLKQQTSPTFAAYGISYIAEATRIHPSTVSKILDALKTQGIVSIEAERESERSSKGQKKRRARVLHNPSRERRSSILNLTNRPPKASAWRGRENLLPGDVREETAPPTANNSRMEDPDVREKTAHLLRSFGVRDRSLAKDESRNEEPEHVAELRSSYLSALSAGLIDEPTSEQFERITQ